MSCRVITKIEEIIGKSLKINIKRGYKIIYVANMWDYVSTNFKVYVCILDASDNRIIYKIVK
jgi:hypothetical protein